MDIDMPERQTYTFAGERKTSMLSLEQIEDIAGRAATKALHIAFDGRGGRATNSYVIDRVKDALKPFVVEASQAAYNEGYCEGHEDGQGAGPEK